jgi:hypothetical protein
MGTSDAPPNEPQAETVTSGGVQTTTVTESKPLEEGATAQEQAQGQPADTSSQDAAPAEPSLADEQAAQAAAQSPAEPQVVPEVRPQAFQQAELHSDSELRAQAAQPQATQEDYDRANSDEAKEAAIKNSRTPNLVVGTRVQIVEPHPEAGRMAFVQQVVPADGIQGMMIATGVPEARFAELSGYIVKTRDGRSDILEVKPDEVKPLDDIQGWGRGQI